MALLKHDHNDCKSKAGAMLDEIERATIPFPNQPTEEAALAPLPEFIFFDDIIVNMPPEPKLLVGGTEDGDKYKNALIHQGDKVMVGAESKAGKTWLLLQKALCIAAGIPFLGHKTTAGIVLYCNFELRPWAFARRVRKVAESLGLVDGQGRVKIPTNFIGWNLRGKCYDIDRVCAVAEERLRAKPGQAETKLAAIVVDPLYKSYGGADENSASDMAAVLEAMERFAEKFGAAILIASHFAKGNSEGKAQIDRISGSGVIARDPDSILTLSRFKDEPNCYTLEATLRNMASPEPKVIEFCFPIWKVRDDLKPTGKGYDLGQFINLLPETGLNSGQWFEAAKEQSICAKDEVFTTLKKDCVEKGLVTETKVGHSKIYKRALGKL